MNEEPWKTCNSGTFDGIARAQRNRNTRRTWLARSVTAVVVLIIPSVLLIGFMSTPLISCQQAVTWFDSARTQKLTAVESRSFKLHLLYCGKCRNSYAEFQQVFQVSHDPSQQGSHASCNHAECRAIVLNRSVLPAMQQSKRSLN